MMTTFKQNLSKKIWQERYCCTFEEGLCDSTIEDSWMRVAHGLASVERSQKQKWKQEFYHLLEGFKFLPAGRIIAGVGKGRNVTLMNCFVMGNLDPFGDICPEKLRESIKTMEYGGGIGHDFSGLDSKVISWMERWDQACSTIKIQGIRRGAMMACLRCDHPEIELFVKSKSSPKFLTNFNISVLVTDKFLEAVDFNSPWPLYNSQGKVVKTLLAGDLWKLIQNNAYEYSEPGVLFIDRINRENNLWYTEKISATNPCGEVPLPPYGACNLGSFNLTAFVQKPFLDDANFDFDRLKSCLSVALRLLDNVLDLSAYPYQIQLESSRNSRRVGIGITGLASTLTMLKMKYGSAESLVFAKQIGELLCYGLYRSSIDLAYEKGSFPLLDCNKFTKRGFVSNLPEDIRSGICSKGIRNSHLLSIAPTGTISLMANNVSSGIEPIFDYEYKRLIRGTDGRFSSYEVVDYAANLYRELFPNHDFPDYFIRARELTPEIHLKMMEVLAHYIDQSISKTINIAEDYPVNKMEEIYKMANDKGLKGCTIFRPSEVRGRILDDSN